MRRGRFPLAGSGCRRTELDANGVVLARLACFDQHIARYSAPRSDNHIPKLVFLHTKSACEVGPTGNVKASVGEVLVNESGKMCRHLGSDVPSAVYGRRGKWFARQNFAQYWSQRWSGERSWWADRSSHSLTTTRLAFR